VRKKRSIRVGSCTADLVDRLHVEGQLQRSEELSVFARL
jgi:hypothetical protein